LQSHALSLHDALPIFVVAPALDPQVRRLDGRHQDLQRAGAVLLLADDLADLVEHPLAERQPGKAAGSLLADHARPQHEPVRDDLGLPGVFLQDGQEVTRQSHEATRYAVERGGITPPACIDRLLSHFVAGCKPKRARRQARRAKRFSNWPDNGPPWAKIFRDIEIKVGLR